MGNSEPDALGVVDGLYGLPQAEFTAARSAAAAQAKQAGDARLAEQIGALRKPTAVAWLANQLVRRHRDEIEPLMQLGVQLRAATAGLDGEQLRRLSVRQYEVVATLIHQAREIAQTAGRPLTDATARGLEDTLYAALADPGAAERLAAGRLTEGMTRIGFPGLEGAAGLEQWTAREPAPAQKSRQEAADRGGRPGGARDRRRAEEERAARAAERVAHATAEAAEIARAEAASELAGAERALADARERVDELKVQLDQAYDERAAADHRLQVARRQAQQADRDARQAARRLADAAERLQ
jgi:hypothetical protein